MRSTESHSGTVELDTAATGASGPIRFLLVGLAFTLYEGVFIWLLGERIYDFPYFSFGMLALVATSSAGYFALGYFSRTWWSGLLLALPVIIALYFVGEVWVIEYPDGSSLTYNANFVEIWLTLTAFFLPAWAIGVWVSRRS